MARSRTDARARLRRRPDATRADREQVDTTFDPCDPDRAPSATTVSETQLNSAFPTPAGGPIADGTYDLARFEVYAPASADGHVRARRMVVQGDLLATSSRASTSTTAARPRSRVARGRCPSPTWSSS